MRGAALAPGPWSPRPALSRFRAAPAIPGEPIPTGNGWPCGGQPRTLLVMAYARADENLELLRQWRRRARIAQVAGRPDSVAKPHTDS